MSSAAEISLDIMRTEVYEQSAVETKRMLTYSVYYFEQRKEKLEKEEENKKKKEEMEESCREHRGM